MEKNLKRQFIWNTLGSGLYSFNSLFFMVIVTRINGVSTAGVFNFCYATSCIFYAIALYSGRTYQVTETQKTLNDNAFILNRFITTLTMLVIAVAFCLINRYSSSKLMLFLLLCFVKAVEAFCDIFHGIFQKNNRLDIAGKSMFFRCLLSIVVFLIIDKITKNVFLASLSLLVACLIFLFCVDMPISKKYKDSVTDLSTNSALKLIKLGFYTFGFTLIANYLVNAPRYPLNSYLGVEFQTIFGIITMPASIILLANQFVLQPMVVRMKDSYLKNDRKGFLSKVYILCSSVSATGVLSVVFAYFLGAPALRLVYGLDVSKYITNLIIIICGVSLYSLSGVMSNALMVLRKTRVQFLIYLITSVFVYFVADGLTLRYGFSGAIFSYFSGMFYLFVLYAVYFIYTIKKSFRE